MQEKHKLISMKEAANHLSYHRVTLSRVISDYKKNNNNELPAGVFTIGNSYRIDIDMFAKNFNTTVKNTKTVNFHKLRNYYECQSAYYSTISKKTVRNHQRGLVLASEFFYNHEFTKENIFKFRNYLLKEKKMAEGSVKKYLNAISSMCRICFECGLLKENISEGIKQGLKTNEIERFLTREERARLKAFVTSYDVLDHIEFAIETGLRKGEQFNLTWDRVDLTKKEIYIVDRKNGKSLTIPISSLAIHILQKRTNLNTPFRNLNHYEIKKAFEEANIHNFRWHDLRHTFATWCIKGWHSWLDGKPLPLDRIQRLLGHARIAMTERYSHLDAGDLHNIFK